MRTIRVAVLAAIGGFCVASGAALGAARLNAWRDFGEQFQLGYVVGYFDALTLAQRRDRRILIPFARNKEYESWVSEVNVFFESPENADKEIADALYSIGIRKRNQILEEWKRRKKPAEPSPSPSTGP